MLEDRRISGIAHGGLWSLVIASALCVSQITTVKIHAAAREEEYEYNSSLPSEHKQNEQESLPLSQRRIRSITVVGNKFTSDAAIVTHVPYRTGEIFDQSKTRILIKNLYQELGRFSRIDVKMHPVENTLVDLYIEVEEKQPLKDVRFVGNRKLSESDFRKKIDFDVPGVDQADVGTLVKKITRLYAERGYNNIVIDASLQTDPFDERVTLIFTIKEGPSSVVRNIEFTGNDLVSSKELRKILFTKEDWLLSFLDNAGTYLADRLEGDRYMIEQYYQNHGFMQARVIDVDVQHDECSKDINLVFNIEEGACYTISEVDITGSDELPRDCVIAMLPICCGERYSREKIVDAMHAIEAIWGARGYIFVHVTPSIQPDEASKTVAISFVIHAGDQVTVNKVTIRGNRKTRDKVIRRQLIINEGQLLTQAHLDISKQNVEGLGYFEPRDGVNWKIHRIGNNKADIELIVHEAKTGSLSVQLTKGGDQDRSSEHKGYDPLAGVAVKGVLADTNLFGQGIALNLETQWAHAEQSVQFHLAKNWLCDLPITGAIDIYHKRPSYEDFRNLQNRNSITAQLTGGGVTAGLITPPTWPIFSDAQFLAAIGVDRVRYEEAPIASIRLNEAARTGYQALLNREFRSGTYFWFSQRLEQNRLSHPIHPSYGHYIRLFSKIGITNKCDGIGFYKLTFDAGWYTPLIGTHTLVLHLHAFAGVGLPLSNRVIPYGELFHVGGPQTVRGFLFGQIGPRFFNDVGQTIQFDAIGSKKAFNVNTELIFPITPDLNLKGVLFYDGGAGWDNPYANFLPPANLTGNGFDYRHAIGVGFQLLNPMPLRVGWGFKIDPRRNRRDPRRDESSYEAYFGMNYTW